MTFLIGTGIILIAAVFQGGKTSQLLNSHSFMLVVGGSFCVLLMTTPGRTLLDLVKAVTRVWREEPNPTPANLKALLHDPMKPLADPHGIIQQARDLWELDMDQEEFEQLLVAHAESCLTRDSKVISAIRNLGKYPPALGMVGTVLGMIELFSTLGVATQQNQIGPQLALAMTATLYGLVLSNYVLVPIADRMEANKEIRKQNLEQTLQVLLSIDRKQPKFVAERVIHAA